MSGKNIPSTEHQSRAVIKVREIGWERDKKKSPGEQDGESRIIRWQKVESNYASLIMGPLLWQGQSTMVSSTRWSPWQGEVGGGLSLWRSFTTPTFYDSVIPAHQTPVFKATSDSFVPFPRRGIAPLRGKDILRIQVNKFLNTRPH